MGLVKHHNMPCNLQHCFGVLFFLLDLAIRSTSNVENNEVHIVYLGSKNVKNNILGDYSTKVVTSDHHVRILADVFSSEEDAKQSVVYSYKQSLSGFSALLNSTQAAALAKKKGVISVYKSKMLQLHTTRSWDFMGLTLSSSSSATIPQLAYADDVIVGLIDTGVWPESESFAEEEAMEAVPCTWKGECVRGEMFDPVKACNRKLIGARFYLRGFEAAHGPVSAPEYRSPRDFLGHGTHTASTAVGSRARSQATFMGLGGTGRARGGAPRARLAVYKACWGKEYEAQCSEADILAAFDDALRDGVHIISASIGTTPPLPEMFASSTSIGSFHAAQLGVMVVFSAGNDGPHPGLVSNVEPWAITVAASTVDREFVTPVVVEGNFTVMGESLLAAPITGKLVDPITYFNNGICNIEYRKNSRKATGRVLLCFSTVGPVEVGEAQEAAMEVNATALIMVQAMGGVVGPDTFPTVYMDVMQGTKLKHYLALFLRLPALQIHPAKTITSSSVAPKLAFFSSRGPSSLSPDILKPDITAPGVNILAAWPTRTAPTVEPSDVYKGVNVSWNIISGTSMSCPHVSGIVALLKSAHPNWSPPMIKSALITTANPRDTSFDYILPDPFGIGAGHVDPLRAMDPGLVYDMTTLDYVVFLCNIGYSSDQIEALLLPDHSAESLSSCSRVLRRVNSVNYPSIAVSDLRSITTIRRKVRNVGQRRFVAYFSSVVEPHGVEVVVWPRLLVFSHFREECVYYVTLVPRKKSQGRYDFGEIVWSDGLHKVRTPLAVSVNTIQLPANQTITDDFPM